MAGRKVVIVGGGLIGLSIARALTGRGVDDVLVLERAELASGGTGKSSGIVRAHYGVPSIAKLSWNSVATMEELGDEIGFRQVGYSVIVGDENVAPLRANIAMQQQLGIETELIDVERLAAMWPHMETGDVSAVGYEPRGGFADATQLALHFGRVARDHGATVRQNTPVARVLTDRRHRLRGRVGERRAGRGRRGDRGLRLVVEEPARAARIDFPCDAYRSELLVVDAGEPLRDLPVVSDLVSLQYCRVEGSGQFLVGNSDHDHAEDKFVDPDHYSNVARDTTIEKYADKIMHRFPGFPDPAVTHSYAGVYDVPPDWNPVIAPLKAVHGVTLAAGFAGHGFKMSPAVGDLVADLLLEGDSTDPDIPASDFVLERFAEGRPLVSPHPYAGAGEMR
jgi:sarcosine oxidase subunit beta